MAAVIAMPAVRTVSGVLPDLGECAGLIELCILLRCDVVVRMPALHDIDRRVDAHAEHRDDQQQAQSTNHGCMVTQFPLLRMLFIQLFMRRARLYGGPSRNRTCI
ncbi:MAG TPA: hypothetical protein PKZ77_05825 [Pseudomonadales bacterium]|nr:hypothetical protein [Pseudomonadales bacterium]HNC69986.1 hypothetical protein [Pseudomonadales bacterium]HND13617.1 hypothetical protein [Pseudomonadales bacterium]